MATTSFAVHKQGALVLTLASSAREDASALIRRLLAAGVPANISDGAGFSALALAARAGMTDTMNVLLDGGASVNLPTRDNGNPPLFWAARAGHGEPRQDHCSPSYMSLLLPAPARTPPLLARLHLP